MRPSLEMRIERKMRERTMTIWIDVDMHLNVNCGAEESKKPYTRKLVISEQMFGNKISLSLTWHKGEELKEWTNEWHWTGKTELELTELDEHGKRDARKTSTHSHTHVHTNM